MHPGITIGPIVGLILGFGVGAVLSTSITRSIGSRVVRWLASILSVGSWLAYVGGVLNWRYNVEPFLDGTEGSGVGFGDIFVHLVALIPALFLTGLAAAVFWFQTRRSSIQRRQDQEAEPQR